METEWWELSEKERIEKIYSKHTIESFWRWWSDDTASWMEIRTYGWQKAKEMGFALNLPFSASGVFVNSAHDLLRSIKYLRTKDWKTPFGLQPRKPNINRKGKPRLGGKDANVDAIKYIFIDIDRKIKNAQATSIELRDCNIIADMILDRFRKKGWAECYAKICSGNGIQLFIKLDVALKMPAMECRKAGNGYVCIPTPQFMKIKKSLFLVGKEIYNFVERKKKNAGIDNVEIDMACFRLAQAGALPFTKNYKYNGFTWRGIVELKDGENIGLADYILSLEPKIEARQASRAAKPQYIDSDLRCIPGKLRENKLIKWFLTIDFPEGNINNTIWFEIKTMLRDNKIEYNNPEVQAIRQELSHRHGGRTFTMNKPDDKYNFQIATVNNYCIRHLIEPIFTLWPERKRPVTNGLSKFDWKLVEWAVPKYTPEEDIIDILRWIKKNVHDNEKMMSYWRGLKEKYGEYKARWWFDHCYERMMLYE